MKLTHLKVKIKTLAAESDIIRHEERRAKRNAQGARKWQNEKQVEAHSAAYHDLYMHRIKVVRPAAREALLAYALLQERNCPEVRGSKKPDLSAVAKMLRAFGWDPMCDTDGQLDIIRDWIKRTAQEKLSPAPPSPERVAALAAARQKGLELKGQIARSRNAG
jgi:hypothetical protein